MLKEIKKYYNNGKLERHYFTDGDDKIHGIYKIYYSTGELIHDYCLNHGNYKGIHKTFNKNSAMKRLSTLKGEAEVLSVGYHGVKIEFNY